MTPDEQRHALWRGLAEQTFEEEVSKEIRSLLNPSQLCHFTSAAFEQILHKYFVAGFIFGARAERKRNQVPEPAHPLRSEPEKTP